MDGRYQQCALHGAIAAIIGWAVANFMPNLASSLPSGMIRNTFLNPIQFGIAVGIIFCLSSLAYQFFRKGEQFHFYSDILKPENYGYTGLAPMGQPEPSRVQFKNYVS